MGKIEQGLVDAHDILAAGPVHQVASTAALGATTVNLKSPPIGFVIGSRVGVGVGTVNCEVRRVTAISGFTLTVSSAFKIAHAANEIVMISNDYLIPLEWWGARTGTTDEYRSIINACLDNAQSGGFYGLSGAGAAGTSYYCSRPWFLNDYRTMENVRITAYYPFGYDLMDGDYDGVPNQY